MSDRASLMTLRLLTPTGVSAETECDSVQLTLRDDAEGKQGGLVGIQRDHAPAVMALGQGPIRASLRQTQVFRATASGGFASVQDNVVTVITDSAVIDEDLSPTEEI